MKIKQSNGYAAILLIIVVSVTFMGYYYMIPVFGQLYERFMDDSTYLTRYPTEELCTGHGYWYDGSCHQMPQRAKDLYERIRWYWLFGGIVFSVGMLIWYLVSVFRSDPQQYYR